MLLIGFSCCYEKSDRHDHPQRPDRPEDAAVVVAGDHCAGLTDEVGGAHGCRPLVLDLVCNSNTPVGAYDILDSLNRAGGKVAPPTVYRALDFLIEADLVHRLDSLNAFVGCPDPRNPHTGQFLICRECRSVAELDDSDIDELVRRKASKLGFTALRQTLEIEGICRNCVID